MPVAVKVSLVPPSFSGLVPTTAGLNPGQTKADAVSGLFYQDKNKGEKKSLYSRHICFTL